MRLILATSNNGKIKEIREIYAHFVRGGAQIIAWSEVITPFEIEENGATFKENALIKSKSVFSALESRGILGSGDIVLSDDSGICVDKLNGAPGIHSARYSGIDGSAAQKAAASLQKLRTEVEKIGGISRAHYCACIGISSHFGDFNALGFMYGEVIAECRGENGFGYDPIFIPKGFKETLAELSSEAKNAISHRRIALENTQYILRALF